MIRFKALTAMGIKTAVVCDVTPCNFVQTFGGIYSLYLKIHSVIFFNVHGTVHLSNTSFIKYQRDATYSLYLVYFLQL